MFIWSAAQGFTPIAPLPFTLEFSFPSDLSANGDVAVGWRDGVQAGQPSVGLVFRWTALQGTQPIPFTSGAAAVSADGRTVVGVTTTGPARWTARGIDQLPSGGTARAVSADGWVVAGDGYIAPAAFAFIWDPVNGLRDLKVYLQSLGVPGLDNWQLTQVVDISWDGTVLVGTGHVDGSTTPNGRWVATIPPFCYANCDGSSVAPALNVADFTCFLRKFAADDIYANCNNDASMDVADFTCFLQKFVQGCP